MRVFKQFNLQLLLLACPTNRNLGPDRLQSNRPSGDVFPLCFRETDRVKLTRLLLAASQSPSKNCRAAAGNSATRRRISRIILTPIVNASNRRRRGLTLTLNPLILTLTLINLPLTMKPESLTLNCISNRGQTSAMVVFGGRCRREGKCLVTRPGEVGGLGT